MRGPLHLIFRGGRPIHLLHRSAGARLACELYRVHPRKVGHNESHDMCNPSMLRAVLQCAVLPVSGPGAVRYPFMVAYTNERFVGCTRGVLVLSFCSQWYFYHCFDCHHPRWRMRGSNPRPCACKAHALPFELIPQERTRTTVRVSLTHSRDSARAWFTTSWTRACPRRQHRSRLLPHCRAPPRRSSAASPRYHRDRC